VAKTNYFAVSPAYIASEANELGCVCGGGGGGGGGIRKSNLALRIYTRLYIIHSISYLAYLYMHSEFTKTRGIMRVLKYTTYSKRLISFNSDDRL
jgi:hypothetical protein